MKFTTFRSKFTSKPTNHEGWEEFVEALSEPIVLDNKQDAPLYSPAVFVGDEARTIDRVLYISFGVIDIDKATSEEVEELIDELVDNEVRFLYHTSYRFSQCLQEGVHKCRLIFPFSRPVTPDEWDRLWYMLNYEVCNGLGDTQCQAPNAVYFFPSHPPGGEGEVIYFEDGDVLDVDFLLENCPPDALKDTDSAFQAPAPALLAHIDPETRTALARDILQNLPDAVEGEGGDRQTLKAAFVGHDFALDPEQFWPLLLEYNQNKCQPPWDESELKKKLNNAYRYSKMPAGWRLADQGVCDDITKEDITGWLKRYMKTSSEERKSEGRLFRSMFSGNAIPVNPERAFLTLAKSLAKEFPNASSAQLVSYFQASIEATSHRDVTLNSVMAAIEEEQVAQQVAMAEKMKERAASRAANVCMAFQRLGIQRDAPYSDAELEQFVSQFPTEEIANRHWIVRHNNSFYFYVLDRYIGPYAGEEANNAAQIMLAPTKFDLHIYQKTGIRPMTVNELVDNYGTIADNIIADMALQKSYYDREESTLYEAPCPMREDIEPKEHPEVDKWLFLLTGKDKTLHEKLLDWLACLPKIEAPCAGLFLFGERGTGKSLLAHACSRLWTKEGPTELQDIAGAFNSRLSQCPVALGDEGPPTDYRGDPETALLRRIIQEHSRTLRRKFMPDAVLKGAMRVIITANNISVLIADTMNLTNNDIDAINERFLVIPVVDADARHYLNRLSEDKRRAITHGTAVVEYALHLHATRKVKYGARLLVEGLPGSDLELTMATSTGIRAEICQWIASYLLEPHKITSQGKLPIVAEVDGRNKLLISAQIIHKHWNTYLSDTPKPRVAKISSALCGISEEQRKSYKNMKYRIVRLDSVQRWAVSVGLCGEESFNEALVKHNLARLQVV